MFQIDNLQPGDIVIFIGVEHGGQVWEESFGLVVEENPIHYDDEQAVLIQFYGGDDFDAGPLHYYHRELDSFLEKGEIRIQHG